MGGQPEPMGMVVPPNSVHICSVWLKDTDEWRLMEGNTILDVVQRTNPDGVISLQRRPSTPPVQPLTPYLIAPIARGYADGKLTLGFTFRSPDVPTGQTLVLENRFEGIDSIGTGNPPDNDLLRVRDSNTTIVQTITVVNDAG